MGRKKKPAKEEQQPQQHSDDEDKHSKRRADYSDSSDYEVERRHHDIDPEIQQLAYAFGIDAALTQKLNDIMIEDRKRTWGQDLERLYEILKEARAPAAVLTLKLNDMEKGKFVGKAKCGPRVRELARKHRLDKGASNKLEEAMSMREAMGKDVEKDLQLLDEHMQASNAPSKLVSMKLESLRKGFNIGHCIYSRDPMPGNQGPGVDGVFDKRERRPLGYTDADLDRRFAEHDMGGGGGQLMDEATVRKMMAAEKKKFQQQMNDDSEEKPERGRKDKARDKEKSRRSRSRSRSRSRGSPDKRKKKRSRTKSRSRSREKAKSKGKSRSRSRRRSSSRRREKSKSRADDKSKKKKDKEKEKDKDKEKEKEKDRSRSRTRR